ncbi:TrkH family potassium uptake protein [Sinanaerobacter sp. ZZT-01]|uniref:TrkH family potassium uptake protein n=1 Tax=Sinanaerobacter sp. ZZT-01 TaxID=3111540 RepID=UPI002D790DC9|nr:TrkH family potassium uptake protein [Sinanaerobacter sp. ZZT-01]WRR92450.1 TrkH family potassium uptake protein [Sinanaerobacter sp. ZZT-01]
MKPDSKVTGSQLILGYLGIILILIGISVLLPLLVLLAYPEEIGDAKYFILPGVSCLFFGYLLSFLVRSGEKTPLNPGQSAFIVTSSWLLAILASGMPFFITGQYNFTQAMFESTSGWSTTGLSVVDVENTSHIFLMHRSLMLFFGGIGLVLIMVSVLKDASGMRLYQAEGHSDKLLPNLIQSSRLILSIYTGYIAAGTVLYMLFGMDWFDAVNHAIAAVATGGFSTKSESIGYFNSVPIEIVSIILMFLGSTNFVASLYIFRGKFRNFFRYCELRFTFFLFLFSTSLFAFFLWRKQDYPILQSFRVAAFQAVSAFSTTGFQTVPSFAVWSSALSLPLILLMIIGGEAGSTAGGVKQFRIWVFLKGIYWSLRDTFYSDRIVRVNYVKKPDTDEVIGNKQRAEIGSFLFLYLLIMLTGTLILCAYGYPLKESLFEISSAMGGVGLSCGITSYSASTSILWVLMCGMFIGRLEIYVVAISVIHLLTAPKIAYTKMNRRIWR